MSLFDDYRYRYRETFFVLFEESDRPTSTDIEIVLKQLEGRYEVLDLRATDVGLIDSFTLLAPDDFSAMDVSYLAGEDVAEQVLEIAEDMAGERLTKDESQMLNQLRTCNARFELFHFEQLVVDEGDDEEEFMDPGALLIVIEKLARICKGIGVDPQSGTLL